MNRLDRSYMTQHWLQNGTHWDIKSVKVIFRRSMSPRDTVNMSFTLQASKCQPNREMHPHYYHSSILRGKYLHKKLEPLPQ
jgi:hypothetical protein